MRLRLRRRGRDRGAVAALVAVLLAGNVMLGMGALAVDVGLYYVEREELQSGADAAAVAVAKICAVDATACEQGDMEDLAQSYAEANAKDDQADVELCGRVRTPGPPPGNMLDDCPDPPGPTDPPPNLTACIGDPPATGHYVEVHTSTRTSDGDNALPPVFAGAVTGTTGTTIAACSRVSWGPVTTGTVDTAFAISICPFREYTSNGSVFQVRPAGPLDYNGVQERYELPPHWETADDTGCNLTPDGSRQMTDGFVWLKNDGFGDCSATVTVGGWYDDKMSQPFPNRCVDKLREAYQTSTPVAVAIFDDRREEPAGQIQVRVAGIASFVVTGWWTPFFFPGEPDEDYEAEIHGKHLWDVEGCRFQYLCIYGYFTTQLVASGEGPIGDPNFGTYYIRTIG